jgi:Flp pilus assembly pilin Flp
MQEASWHVRCASGNAAPTKDWLNEAQHMKDVSITKLARHEHGLSTLEYSVLFVIILVGAIMLWTKLGDTLLAQFGEASAEDTHESSPERVSTP